jgi:hypothetical protein
MFHAASKALKKSVVVCATDYTFAKQEDLELFEQYGLSALPWIGSSCVVSPADEVLELLAALRLQGIGLVFCQFHTWEGEPPRRELVSWLLEGDDHV